MKPAEGEVAKKSTSMLFGDDWWLRCVGCGMAVDVLGAPSCCRYWGAALALGRYLRRCTLHHPAACEYWCVTRCYLPLILLRRYTSILLRNEDGGFMVLQLLISWIAIGTRNYDKLHRLRREKEQR